MPFQIPEFINFKPQCQIFYMARQRQEEACDWRDTYVFLENPLETTLFDLNLSNMEKLITLARQLLFSHFKALKVPKLPRETFINPHFGIPS